MAIKGYRWYMIEEDQLQSIGMSSDQNQNIISPATCDGATKCCWYGTGHLYDLTPPTKSCHCGYYAYYTAAGALLGNHRNLAQFGNTTLVEVLAWGRIQHHQKGFRAERISLSRVFVSGPMDERIADLYLCNKATWADALGMLTEKQVKKALYFLDGDLYYKAKRGWS